MAENRKHAANDDTRCQELGCARIPPGDGNVWKLGEGSQECIFLFGIPACCQPVRSQTHDGCGNLWPHQLVTGEISGKGHHGKGVGPWIDLLEPFKLIMLIVTFVYVIHTGILIAIIIIGTIHAETFKICP